MQFIPKEYGDTIYATKDGVNIYKEADVTTPYTSIRYKSDTPSFDSDDLIGKFVGVVKSIGNTIWYKVEWIHTYRVVAWWQVAIPLPLSVLLRLQKKTETLEGWVKGDDIATARENDVSDTKKKEETKLLEKKLEDLDKPPIPTPKKGFFASIFGPTINEDGTVENNNIAAVVSVIVILLLSIVGLIFLRRRKTAKAQPTVTIVRKNGKNYIVNQQTNK